MRTANEWYRKINSYSNPETMNDVPREWVEKMVNEARIEAIKEAAEVARILYYDGHNKVDKSVKYFQSGADNIQVDKQSIFSLIKEIK